MERIKKKMGNVTPTWSTLNLLITLYKEYERNCDRQPQKLDKWTKWFLNESFVIMLNHDKDLPGSKILERTLG